MKRELNITIYEKPNDSVFCPSNNIYVGGLLVVNYGWNYRATKSSKNRYCVESKIMRTVNKTTFETEEQAKDAAYRIVELFLKHLEK